MGFARPEFDRETVDTAGEFLRAGSRDFSHLRVINNWRAAHSYPLNTFQMALRHRAAQLDPTAIVAQRTKRLRSMTNKLVRLDWLSLSEMQDIAGCRAIVMSVAEVDDLVAGYKRQYGEHELISESDYIDRPKSDGYRSHHLIYRYRHKHNHDSPYNGLKVEIQLRSELQHCWATAVEIADFFLGTGIKSHSTTSQQDWGTFFALMATAMAAEEGRPPVPRTPTDEDELLAQLTLYAEKLDVVSRLEALGATLTVAGEEELRKHRIRYIALEFTPNEAQSLRIFGYRSDMLEQAMERIQQVEGTADAVLVSVSDVRTLRQAYPNYFFDTTRFLGALNEYTSLRTIS